LFIIFSSFSLREKVRMRGVYLSLALSLKERELKKEF